MSHQDPGLSGPTRLPQKALARWENEGGARSQGPQGDSTPGIERCDHVADVTNSELVLLRVRMIALENLLIALPADASERQLELARDATTYISPRPGFTVHSLTVRAATHMSNLIERAAAFRG